MKKVFIVAAVLLAGVTACKSGNNTKKNVEGIVEEAIADIVDVLDVRHKDCNKEGYVWSDVKDKCIRLFEQGVSFVAAENSSMDHIAYAVFSKDSSKVELFIPGAEKSEILDRRTTPTGPTWNVEDDDTKNVRVVNGQWVIQQRGKIIYKHTAELGPHKARFQGSDGLTRRMYWIDAIFYPDAGKAIVTVDKDTTYELAQYPTASGYGYKNDKAELRGKGKDATLSFTDKELRELTLLDVTGME